MLSGMIRDNTRNLLLRRNDSAQSKVGRLHLWKVLKTLMALETIRICLRAWAEGEITGTNFFKMLGLTTDDGWQSVAGTEISQAALIYFVEEEIASYQDLPEPSESLSSNIEQQLLKAAEWLLSREPDVFECCRESGLRTDIFIGGWIDQNQIDLSLPATFLLACGRAGLSIEVVTND
jgi:hypothetical protein